MDPADQQLLDLIGEELQVTEDNLIESLSSTNSNIKLKALNFINNHYTKIQPGTIKQAIQIIPKLLQTTQSQILSKTLDFIIKMSNVTYQRYLDVSMILFNLIKFSINQPKSTNQKTASVQGILIKFIEPNEFLNIVLTSLNQKNFQSICNALNFMVLGLTEFGGVQLNNLDSVFPVLERLLTNSSQEFRILLVNIYKEMYKFLGNHIDRSLRYFQKLEQLEIDNFRKTWGNQINQGRREQIQQAKQMNMSYRQNSLNSSRQINKSKSKFWDNYQENWMFEFQKTTKWKGRLEILKKLKKSLQKQTNVTQGNYKNVYMILQTSLSDPNFHIQLISIKIIKLIAQMLKSNFKEMHYLFQFMLPFFKKKDERITKYLFQCFMEFMNYLKIQQIIEELKSALKSKNSIYKINVLKFTYELIEKKIQQNKMNEVKYLYDHFSSIFKRLDIDPNKEIRQTGKDLMNLLIQQTIDNNSLKSSFNSGSNQSRRQTLLKLKTELSQNISEIIIDPERSNKKFGTLLGDQEYAEKNLRRNFSNQVLKVTGLKQNNSFLKNDYGRRTQLQDQRYQFDLEDDDYDIKRRVSHQSNNKFDISDNDQELLKIMERRNSQQQQINLQIKEPFLGNNLDLSSCQNNQIDWEQRDKNKLLQQLEQYLEGKIMRSEDTNEILYELEKHTNQFREINSNKNFSKFLTNIINMKTLEIDEETFNILKNEIAKNIQKDKNCKLSFAFMEKLLVILGPYKFFETILSQIYQRGFNHRNFVWILYQLTRRIPDDLFYDGHLILLHRNLHLFFDYMDIQKDFINLLNNIIQKKIYYLRKNFPELNYIDFSEIKEIKEVEKINFHIDIYNQIQALKKNFLNEEVAHYKAVDITEELDNFIEESRINLNKKKSILDKLFLILVQNAKFILKTQKIDDKLQVLMMDCLNGQEYNKKILKLLSKIFFVYSHCSENMTFKFQDKIIRTFLPVFLKEKNTDTRQYFSFALKRHFSNEKMSQIPYYCGFLREKSTDLKIELLQILFDFFDNQPEENILKVKKTKVFPPLLELLKNKNKIIKNKAAEFLEFLLTFFPQKSIVKIARKCSKEALEFVNKFYKQNQQPTEIQQKEDSIDESDQTITLRESLDQSQITPNLTQNLKTQLELIQQQQTDVVKQKKRYSNAIVDQNNIIYFQELEKIPILELVENLFSILESVFIFQISEVIRTIIFTDESDDIDALFNIQSRIITQDNILQINIIPLYLSIFFNLQDKFPHDKEINKRIFQHLLILCDTLRNASQEEPICLISEEFQLLMEIIQAIQLDDKEDINLMDQMIHSIVIDHIDYEDTIFVLNNLESDDLEQQRIFIMPIQQGELVDDLLAHYENVESFYRLLYNFSFGTEDLILDIILKNQFFSDLKEDEQVLSIFIFSIVFKRIKKSIVNQNYVNDKFLNFLLEKCYDYLKDNIGEANEVLIKDFLVSLLNLCYNNQIEGDIVIMNLFKWIELIQTPTIINSLCDVQFDNKEQDNFVCQILIDQLENDDIESLLDYAEQIQDRPNLNKIGQYIVNLQKTQSQIQQSKKDFKEYEKLINEYNNFDWEKQIKQFL